MPPKQRITREMILERALDIFCREGMDAVNARSVAKALNCSTQPIFSYYTGMPELRETLDQKAREIFAEQVLAAPRSDAWPTELAMAYVRFACEQPHLYRYLFDSACSAAQRLGEYDAFGAELAAHVARAEGVSEDAAAAICREMLVYVTGLAAFALIGVVQPDNVRAKIERAYRAAVGCAQ